jgi:YfiH family protein
MSNGNHDWIVPQWPAPAKVRALITTRNGRASTGPYTSFNLGMGSGDAAAAVTANRAQLRVHLPADPVWLRQVHGIAVANADDHVRTAKEIEADAAIARKSNTICAVMVADCLPVLLADREGRVVGAAHAGWRGLAAGVIERTVEAMNTTPDSLVAFLGPCISGSVYEVGNDVRDAFCAADADAGVAFAPRPNGKWLANLPLLARQRLTRLGVMPTQIFGGGWCTFSDPARFYSYRRDGPSGRMAALIWKEQ